MVFKNHGEVHRTSKAGTWSEALVVLPGKTKTKRQCPRDIVSVEESIFQRFILQNYEYGQGLFLWPDYSYSLVG